MSRGRMIVVTTITLASATAANARPHRHRPCANEERVLGRRTCGVFGEGTIATRLPAITLGLLAQTRLLDAPAPTAHDGPLAREQQPGGRNGRLATIGPGTRLIAGLASRLYAGFEGSGGFGLDTSGRYGAFAAILGGRYRLERTTLGLEAAAGVISVGTGPLEPRLDLDLRVRIDLWVSPWVTLGVFAGVDPFARDQSFGAQLALHLRAFDGDR